MRSPRACRSRAFSASSSGGRRGSAAGAAARCTCTTARAASWARTRSSPGGCRGRLGPPGRAGGQGKDDIAVAFIGRRRRRRRAVFHEILLLARFWGSPCLIVCENNGLAHSMAVGAAVRRVRARSRGWWRPAASWRLRRRARRTRGARGRASELVAQVRKGRPAFLECGVFRVRPHSLADPDYRYRAAGRRRRVAVENDPIENAPSAPGAGRLRASSTRSTPRWPPSCEAALAAAEAGRVETPAADALEHRVLDAGARAHVSELKYAEAIRAALDGGAGRGRDALYSWARRSARWAASSP